MTFSSGIPILYGITFVSFIISFWVDKFLMLRYFRKQNSFTSDLSKAVVSLLPLAVYFHIIMGFMMFSCPQILKSENVANMGNGSQYWNSLRVSQKHVLVFFIVSLIIGVIMAFEGVIDDWIKK